MFDYAFANYQLKSVVNETDVLQEKIPVTGGKYPEIGAKAQRSAYVFTQRGESVDVSVETRLFEKVKAPINKGDKVGEIVVYKNNVECDRLAVVATEDCPSATFIDNFRKVANHWTIR